MDDYFITIKNHVEVTEYIEKSRFISQAFSISSEEEAFERISTIKKAHYKATHNVYAYVIGENKEIQKSTDDGEPSGTAGVPILEIIKKDNITNVLIVVTRYFGGIKLGAGGLIRAAHMAKLALDQSEKIFRLLCSNIRISIDYPYWGKVENYINNNNKKIHISFIDYTERVNIGIYVQDEDKNELYNAIKEITNGNVSIEELGKEYVTLPYPL